MLLGFGAGSAIGLVLGAIVGLSRTVCILVSPLIGALRAVPGIGPRRASRTAGAVIAVEASAAVLMLVPVTARGGAVLAAGLLATFTAGTGWLVYRRIKASCGCFGGTGAALRGDHVVRNAVLTAVAVLPAAAGRTPDLEWRGSVIAALAGCVFAYLMTRWDDIAALVGPGAPARPANHVRH